MTDFLLRFMIAIMTYLEINQNSDEKNAFNLKTKPFKEIFLSQRSKLLHDYSVLIPE